MYSKRNNELKILALYSCNYSSQYYLREISKLVKIPLKTTQNILKRLEKGRIIKSLVRGKNKYFMLNLNSMQTKFFLMQTELYRTWSFLEKYTLFKLFLKDIKAISPIIIFGSFAKFTADKDSDVDMLIVSAKEQKLPTHLLPNKIHQINLSEKIFFESLEKQEPLIKEIEESHIILNNYSFFVNSMWRMHYGR